jgi:hypothetical protein
MAGDLTAGFAVVAKGHHEAVVVDDERLDERVAIAEDAKADDGQGPPFTVGLAVDAPAVPGSAATTSARRRQAPVISSTCASMEWPSLTRVPTGSVVVIRVRFPLSNKLLCV